MGDATWSVPQLGPGALCLQCRCDVRGFGSSIRPRLDDDESVRDAIEGVGKRLRQEMSEATLAQTPTAACAACSVHVRV